MLWLARRLGLGLAAALAAALVYQLSPYVLPYVSRTSAMLLPWAGLGWIVGLHRPRRHRGRGGATPPSPRSSSSTVGAVNATALLMIAPAPVLWLLVAACGGMSRGGARPRTALRIGGLSLGVSLWWIAMRGRSRAAAAPTCSPTASRWSR